MNNDLLQTTVNNLNLVPALPGLRPLNVSDSDELAFVQALACQIKISDCTFEGFKPTLKFCITLVGLRAQNFPSEEEKQFLYLYAKEHFGKCTLEEVRLAFTMAVDQKLEIKEVECYENFSVMYMSKILSAYRAWANMKHKQIIEPMYIPEQKVYESDWRELIETEYQKFIKTGKVLWKIWPQAFYDVMTEDKFLEEGVYEQYLNSEAESLENFIKLKMSAKISLEEKKTIAREVNRKITDLNSRPAAEKIATAKKYSVLMLFYKAKEFKKANLYVNEK